MERFDACVEFHTLYEYCGCKFEELKHNELHHGIKKICHFVQPHYTRIPEECVKYKTHPFSPGRQGTRIYKAIHIDVKAEQHVLLTPNKVEEKRARDKTAWVPGYGKSQSMSSSKTCSEKSRMH